ncbi:MAG: DUF45 domain-containing protein [Methylophaga sp.]|nr:DUF45 domain-containing protein [Methylophaga sp.]
MQTIQGDGFIVTVIKSSRRKTSALKIKDQLVSIHIPSRLPLKFARDFVLQKTSWIQKKLAEQSQKETPEKQFIDGDVFLFLGKEYTLRLIQADTSASVTKTSFELELHGRLNRLSITAIRTALIRWYKQQAEHYLTSRTAEIAREIDLTPTSITVKTYKARWGSCGVRGDVQFNWKLMLAPPDIIDYVIIHELCHLKHHNHSALFWHLVEHNSPTFKASRQWLKSNGHCLEI